MTYDYFHQKFKLFNWFRFKLAWNNDDHVNHINNILEKNTNLNGLDLNEIEYHLSWLLSNNFDNFDKIHFDEISFQTLLTDINQISEQPILQILAVKNGYESKIFDTSFFINYSLENYLNKTFTVKQLEDNFYYSQKDMYLCASYFTKYKNLFTSTDIKILDDLLENVSTAQIRNFVYSDYNLGIHAKEIIPYLTGYNNIKHHDNLLSKVVTAGFFSGQLDKTSIQRIINDNIDYNPLKVLSFASEIGYSLNEKNLSRIFKNVKNDSSKLLEFKTMLKLNINKFYNSSNNDFHISSLEEIKDSIYNYEEAYKNTALQLEYLHQNKLPEIQNTNIVINIQNPENHIHQSEIDLVNYETEYYYN